MNPDPRAETALDEAIALLAAESGTVHLSNPERSTLYLAAVRGPMPEPVLAAIREIPWGKGMAGLAALRLEPVQTCNIQTTTSADVRPGARATGLSGAIVVPILSGDDVVGTIGVGVRAERTFTSREADRLIEHGRAFARRLAPAAAEALGEALRRQVDEAGMAWLAEQIEHAARGERDALTVGFPAAARKLGRGMLGARGALAGKTGEVPLRGWRVDDAGRALVLASYPGDCEALARELYFAGDLREKASALRALALWGEGGLAADAVLDAVRVSAVELFEAAMADNPYATRALSEPELHKAVLKCAFLGVTLDRVSGLSDHAGVELTRMLLSYVTEREVAGRSVPPDIWETMARAPLPGLGAKLLGYLEHPTAAHRGAAATALALLADPRARGFLEDRLSRETDEAVCKALARALEGCRTPPEGV